MNGWDFNKTYNKYLDIGKNTWDLNKKYNK